MFDNVFGHERIKEILVRMVTRSGVHHGLLFHGPHGIGKRLMARELSKVMLCERGTGCGECSHCLKFVSGNHPDYKEISPDGAQIKVDQVREIAENLHFRPFEATVRCIVIDGAERFREEAANAFLKSLEEPPEYVYFILIASDVKALLPTIRSRCQKIAFQTLTVADKARILTTKFGKDEVMASRLAAISFRQLETEDEAWTVFRDDVGKALTFLNLMLEEGHALDYFVDIQRDKEVWPRFQDHLLAVIRQLTLLARGMPLNPLFEEFSEAFAAMVTRRDARAWRALWEEMVQLQGRARFNLNQGLWLNAISLTGLESLERSRRAIQQRLTRR